MESPEVFPVWNLSNVMVIIPCYNEEISIGSTIEKLLRYLEREQILVIDNASTDGTSRVAKKMGVSVSFEPKKGKGYAVRNGFERIPPKYDLIFMIDGDDTYSIDELPDAIKMINDFNFDMIIGTRNTILSNLGVDIEKQNLRKPQFRRGHSFGNRILTRIYIILFKLQIEDTLSGWRLMTYPFIKAFSGGDSGFEIETELNVHAYSLARATANIDVQYYGRILGSESKLRTFRDGFQIVRKMFQLFRHEKPLIYMFGMSIPFAVSGTWLILRAIIDYLKLHLVQHFPSLILGTGLLLNFFVLNLVGISLSHIQEASSRVMRYQYLNAK